MDWQKSISNLVIIFPLRKVLESTHTSSHANPLTIWSKKPTNQPALCPLAASMAVSTGTPAEAEWCFGQTRGGKHYPLELAVCLYLLLLRSKVSPSLTYSPSSSPRIRKDRFLKKTIQTKEIWAIWYKTINQTFHTRGRSVVWVSSAAYYNSVSETKLLRLLLNV